MTNELRFPRSLTDSCVFVKGSADETVVQHNEQTLALLDELEASLERRRPEAQSTGLATSDFQDAEPSEVPLDRDPVGCAMRHTGGGSFAHLISDSYHSLSEHVSPCSESLSEYRLVGHNSHRFIACLSLAFLNGVVWSYAVLMIITSPTLPAPSGRGACQMVSKTFVVPLALFAEA